MIHALQTILVATLAGALLSCAMAILPRGAVRGGLVFLAGMLWHLVKVGTILAALYIALAWAVFAHRHPGLGPGAFLRYFSAVVQLQTVPNQ